MKLPPPQIPSPEWFDLKCRFYAVLIREGCTPEMAEEIVRERHAMYMQNEFEYRQMVEQYEKSPGPKEVSDEKGSQLAFEA
jgi:hypothetical protein